MSDSMIIFTTSEPWDDFEPAIEIIANARQHYQVDNGQPKCLSETIEFERDDLTYIITMLAFDSDVLEKVKKAVLTQVDDYDFADSSCDHAEFLYYCRLNATPYPELENVYLVS